MSNSRPYPKAPITEAVLDLRVAPRAEVRAGDLIRVRAGDEAAYPTAEPLIAVMNQLVLNATASNASTIHQQTGFVFRRQDGRYIHQARLDGFTISQLPPYSEWCDFRAEAFRYWQRYREIARPVGVVRAGLRYVNRIDIPKPIEEIDIHEYLLTAPSIAKKLPQLAQGFFMQLAISFPETQSRALITETIIPPAKPGVVSLVLDIDTFHDYAAPATDEQVWRCLEDLRDLKNEVFEACITDRARELFQ